MRGLLFLLLLPLPAWAESVAPARTIRAMAVIGAEDVTVLPRDTADGFTDIAEVIGQEARVTLYAGRPIRTTDIGPPALIDRNQIVTLTYSTGGLRIAAEGRALGRGGAGDTIRVMNLSSRSTVTGSVRPDGTVSALTSQ